ncbi:SDR family oxidoreductase [Actinacidiphila alni]|uniref:SDR family oxidoreductase n=1 Tax=Actinacidiphila alni TaxID=380248 RepID=UPI003457355F
MRVFVTGASGGIGSVVVPELLAAGHEVLALARSESSAKAVTAAGATPLSGSLTDPASLRAGAAEADGVIHLAFGNDFTDFDRCVAEEALAVEAFGDALKGTGKPLVIASGTPAVPGRASTEEDQGPLEGPASGRFRNAQAALALAAQDVRSGVVRLPRSVHDEGGPYGFAGFLIRAARQTGVSGYVGDGAQRWPAVHRKDAARLFRLVLEQGEPGTVAHAVGDEGDSMLTIAGTIAAELGLETKAVPAEGFGFLGTIFGFDQPSTATLTRERFGWEPTHPSLLADLAAGNYPV